MFYYFFLKYKSECYKQSWKNILPSEWVGLFLLIASGIPVCWLMLLKKFNYTSIISLFVFIIDIIWIIYHFKKKEKKQVLNDRISKYKSERINCIIKLLRTEEFNLYSIQGIDWLINCCKEENLNTPKISLIPSTIFPVITLAYGYLITKMSDNEVVWTTLLLMLLFLMIKMLGYAIKQIIIDALYPDKDKYVHLKEDLEYIKTQYSNIPQISILQCDIR
jgi:membrane protein implicated in regulation of membrane protease activity